MGMALELIDTLLWLGIREYLQPDHFEHSLTVSM
jgi:hypothetical protein